MFQFTHPRGVRRSNRPPLQLDVAVSIHAPARGATSIHTTGMAGTCVSIHAPARGATGDQTRKKDYDNVSIHAPARGATLKGLVQRNIVLSFNSRTREGCDTCLPREGAGAQSFNSRTREGCDLHRHITADLRRGFNSRTREGCDRNFVLSAIPIRCFNSRTREGCDAEAASISPLRRSFQFTHPRGVRLQEWGGGCGAASTDLL